MTHIAHPGDPTDRWQLFTATSIGASHLADGLPCQDAVTGRPTPWTGRLHPLLVAAVADGHGHPIHFRSDRGARFAVEVACEVGLGLADRLDALSGTEVVTLGHERLAPAIVEGWRSMVGGDVEREPLPVARGLGGTVAYGSTLVVVVAGSRWVLIGQIGDGDVVATAPDGRTWAPVAADPEIVGPRTTSLCQPDPLRSFRIAVIDRAQWPLLAVTLATDGFGNAQDQDPWQPGFGADLATLIRERGAEWVGRALPSWAERCASTRGSGDDVTLAVLVLRPVAGPTPTADPHRGG